MRETDFLTISPEVKNLVLSSVEDKVRRIFNQMPLLPVHDISHVERVVFLIKRICEGERTDSFLPQVAAWLHDVGRLQETEAKKEGKELLHAEESAKQVPSLLLDFEAELGEKNIKLIQDAIARHSSLNKDDDSFL